VNEATLVKMQRVQQIASENNLPNISLLESGGANLTQQFKVFHIGGGFFRGLSIKSRLGILNFNIFFYAIISLLLGIPTITVVLGTCTAGGAYNPGMSDYTIMVKNQGKLSPFLFLFCFFL
jgi:acetyl-CoA carboxylase carboxyltransferase component